MVVSLVNVCLVSDLDMYVQGPSLLHIHVSRNYRKDID